MAALKPIKALRTQCDLSAFSNILSLPPKTFFPALWTGIFDLLLLNTHYEAIQSLFINTVYFFPSMSLFAIEKCYSKFIKDFLSIISSANPTAIKSKLSSADLSALLEDLQSLLPTCDESLLIPLVDLLDFTKICVIEKNEGTADTCWGPDDAFLQIFVFRTKTEAFLLYPKDKVTLNLSGDQEDEPDLPLEAINEDEVLCKEEEDSEELTEDRDSDEEAPWTERQEVLNQGKRPIIKSFTQISSPASFSELSLSQKDSQKFSSSICLNSSNFFSSLVLALMELFASRNLHHISLQIFTNSLYYFPFAQSKEFERKHLKFTQDFINAFSQEQEKSVQEMLKSAEIVNILNEIGENIERNSESAIHPLFPLIQTWKLSLIEKSQNSEYVWQVRKPLATLILYLHQDQVHLLVPKSSFMIKEFKVKNELLASFTTEDTLNLQDDEESVMLVDSDVLLSEDQEGFSEDTLPVSFSRSKSVRFKPDLAITIDKLYKEEPSPLPAMPRSALRRPTANNTNPDKQNVASIIAESPVIKFLTLAMKNKGPMDKYVNLAKAKAKLLKTIN